MAKQKSMEGGTEQKVKLSAIGPNPSKLDRFGKVNLQPEKAAALDQSVDESGFWMAPFHVRPNPYKGDAKAFMGALKDYDYLIAYGHHRLDKARRHFGKDASFPVMVHPDMDAREALRTMIEENRETYGDTTRTQAENIEATVAYFRDNLADLRKTGQLPNLNPKLTTAFDAAAENPFELKQKANGDWPTTTYTAQDVTEFAKMSYRTVARQMKALRGLRAAGVPLTALDRVGRDSLERIGDFAGAVAKALPAAQNGVLTLEQKRAVETFARECVSTVDNRKAQKEEQKERADATGTEAAPVMVKQAFIGKGREAADDGALAVAIAKSQQIRMEEVNADTLDARGVGQKKTKQAQAALKLKSVGRLLPDLTAKQRVKVFAQWEEIVSAYVKTTGAEKRTKKEKEEEDAE